MEKEEQRFLMKFLWLKGWDAKRTDEELTGTLGDDSYGVSQIKICFQKFRNVIYPAETLRAPDDHS
jgi:hypothetical protein